MEKITLVVVMLIALLVGGAGGRWIARGRYETLLSSAAENRSLLEQELGRFRETANNAEQEAGRLRTENEALENEVSSLEMGLAAQPVSQGNPAAPPGPEPEATTSAPAAPQVPGPKEPTTQEPPGPVGVLEAGPPLSKEQAREREEQRRRWADELRQRTREAMQTAIGKDADRTTQDRVAALDEYFDYTMDLAQQMREAQSDEERQALRDELGEAMRTSREIVTEQQDHMLRQIASQNGINSPEAQNRFVESMRETLDTPFFRAPGPGMMGLGGPRERRGRGGMAPSQNAPNSPSGSSE